MYSSGGDTGQPAPLQAPDNARYLAPKVMLSGRAFDDDYVNGAVRHLQGISFYPQKLGAFWSMYMDPTHSHYMDIKRFDGPDITPYYSEAAGREISGVSAFEPFGNFIYDLVGALGGIALQDLRFAADVTQERRRIGIGDSAEDGPHVEAGIAAATRYVGREGAVLRFGDCV